MTTNDITLDDARLAEIEVAARAADIESLWMVHDRHYVLDFDGSDCPPTIARAGFGVDAAHIVATQPRVALAMVAEIRRLRAEVAALRGEGAK